MKSQLRGSTRSYPIVGMHFRHQHGVPAKALVARLQMGTRLTVQAEPTNQFDPNAIMVLLRGDDIPEDCLEDLAFEAEPYGFTLDDCRQDTMHIGYIPKELAAILRERGVVPDEGEIEAEFAFGPRGRPLVCLEE